MHENLFYIVLPYVAVSILVVVSIYRFVWNKFSYSSLSSQFLESDELFFGSVPWHIGIMGVLLLHLVALFFPSHVLWFNSAPIRLYLLEITGFVFGLMALVGIVSLAWRRITTARIRAVTTPIDIVVLVLLLVQVVLGVYTAIFYRWGSSWGAATVVPYLYSLFKLQPDVSLIAPLPLIIKLHIANAYLILLVFPFSRLVHMFSIPIAYIWRPYQQVIWNWDRKKIRGQYTRKKT